MGEVVSYQEVVVIPYLVEASSLVVAFSFLVDVPYLVVASCLEEVVVSFDALILEVEASYLVEHPYREEASYPYLDHLHLFLDQLDLVEVITILKVRSILLSPWVMLCLVHRLWLRLLLYVWLVKMVVPQYS